MKESKANSDIKEPLTGFKLSPEIEQQIISKWENAGISNDFIFCKVMQDKELLSELIHLILPDLKFKELEVQAQKAVEIGMDIHGVRFDVFITLETGEAVEIEMQVLDQGNLPKRLRFYSSMADTQMLEKGVVYSKLKNSYVVMICPFDYYGRGRHIYTFTNRCHQEQGLEMGDGTTKIVLNAVGTMNDVTGRLKEFLDYVIGKQSDDEYVKKLDEAVKKARANKEWRREFMTLMMRDLENQEIGIQKGIEKGIEKGIQKGIEKGRDQIIITLLKKGKTPEEIAELIDLSIDYVRSVEESLVQMV